LTRYETAAFISTIFVNSNKKWLCQHMQKNMRPAFQHEHSTVKYDGVSKSFRTGRLEQELQMIQLSATRCSCITILWVSLVSFAAITLSVVFQRVFIVVYFVIDTPSYTKVSKAITSFVITHTRILFMYLKNRGIWVATPCSVAVGYQRLGGPWFLHLQIHDPEDLDLNLHRRESLESRISHAISSVMILRLSRKRW
jgi:hypothetical protein